MLRSSVLLMIALALPAQDQTTGWLMSGSATLANGVRIRYHTVAQPPLDSAAKLDIGGVAASPRAVHRSMSDPRHRRYFGYDVSAESSGPGEYRVAFAPLSMPPDASFQAVGAKFPRPQIVRD